MSGVRHSRRHRANPWWLMLGIGFGSLLWFALGTAIATLFASHVSAAECRGAIRHPIEVRVQALDPVRHGSTVRLQVTVTSGVTVRGLEARLDALGGATAASANRAFLGGQDAGERSQAEFRVAIPAQGRRFLLQFRVEGEGPAGRIGRGATYNLLPDGAIERGRRVESRDGRTLYEVVARKVEP